MKIVNEKLFYILIISVIGFTACDKRIDLLPTDSINEANAFQSVTDLEQGLLNAYGSISGENIMYANAIIADEVKVSNENRGQGQFEFKWQYVPVAPTGGVTIGAWDNLYLTIGDINKVLAATDNVVAATPAEETEKQKIKGELLGLRAILHFYLLQMYTEKYNPSAQGIPYTTTSDITAKPSRQPVSEVIANIENELAAAKAAPLPTEPPITPTVGTIRLSKAAISGFQARVALYKGEWSNAENLATEAINFASKPLANTAEYPLIWTDETETEVIWKLRRTGTSVGTLWQDNNDDVFFEPSDKLKNLYDRDNDIRFQTFFLINNPGDDDTALINKFRASIRGLRINDVKMMRSSELYLIRAEARAEQDNLTGAAEDYNTIRRQRIDGYVDESFSSKAEAIMAILNERARELAFEGFRFFDLKRRGLSVNRLPSDVQSTEWLNLPADNFRFLFPIPQRSILANPNMVQNPGY